MAKLTIEELEEKKALATETNTVNPNTFLSTDYLNHYNEVIMLIDMLPSMPDVIDMVMEWQPKTYIEYFQHSTLPNKDTAIELYEFAPQRLKMQYDAIVNKIDEILLKTLNDIIKIDIVHDQKELKNIITEFSEIHKYISIISNTVNGQIMNIELVRETDIHELDTLFEEYSDDIIDWELDESVTFDQEDIDALFD